MGAIGRNVVRVLAVLLFCLVLGSARRVQGQSGEASGEASGQASGQVAAPGAVVTEGGLPAEWSAGVKKLAGGIVGAVKPARAVSLEVRNISSLGAAEVEAIQKGLEAELRSRGVKAGGAEVEANQKGLEAELRSRGVKAGAEPAEASVTVTLSENVEGYVWVATVHRVEKDESALSAAIVSVPRVGEKRTGQQGESLTLSRELVWEQSARFLDFSVFAQVPGAAGSTLAILEPERLNYYESRNAAWSSTRSVNFPHVEPEQRDPRGGIASAENAVYAPGIRCVGDVADPAKLECAAWANPKQEAAENRFHTPGHGDGEAAAIADRCGGKMVAVASADGDWTQPDFLQAYLVADFREDGEPSGSEIAFDGPVVALHGDGKDTFRAVVHSLKSGNYEGYIVTATCNH